MTQRYEVQVTYPSGYVQAVPAVSVSDVKEIRRDVLLFHPDATFTVREITQEEFEDLHRRWIAEVER